MLTFQTEVKLQVPLHATQHNTSAFSHKHTHSVDSKEKLIVVTCTHVHMYIYLFTYIRAYI